MNNSQTRGQGAAFLPIALAILVLCLLSSNHRAFTPKHSPAARLAPFRTPSNTPLAPNRKKINMALPTSVTTNDAGILADRLTYPQVVGVDANGNHYYQSGSKYIYYALAPAGAAHPQWCLGSTLNGEGYVFDYYTSGSVATPTNLPLTGWGIGGGTSPAPTFTASYAPTAPTAPGTLTMTIT